MSARRAVSVTLPPGPKASTSNSNFCSSLHRRRRSVPVISVEYAMLLLTPLQTTLLAVQLCLNHRKAALTGGVRRGDVPADLRQDVGSQTSTPPRRTASAGSRSRRAPRRGRRRNCDRKRSPKLGRDVRRPSRSRVARRRLYSPWTDRLAPLLRASRTHHIADAPPVDPADRDHAVVALVVSGAGRLPAVGQPREGRLGLFATGLVQLWGIEVCEPHLHPPLRPGAERG